MAQLIIHFLMSNCGNGTRSAVNMGMGSANTTNFILETIACNKKVLEQTRTSKKAELQPNAIANSSVEASRNVAAPTVARPPANALANASVPASRNVAATTVARTPANALANASMPASRNVAATTVARTPANATNQTPITTNQPPRFSLPTQEEKGEAQKPTSTQDRVNVQVNVMVNTQTLYQANPFAPNFADTIVGRPSNEPLAPICHPDETQMPELPSNEPLALICHPDETQMPELPSNEPLALICHPDEMQMPELPSNEPLAPICHPDETQMLELPSNDPKPPECPPNETHVQESEPDQANSFKIAFAAKQSRDWKMKMLAISAFCVITCILLFIAVHAIVDDKEFSTYAQKRCKAIPPRSHSNSTKKECNKYTISRVSSHYENCALAACAKELTPTFINKAYALWGKYS